PRSVLACLVSLATKNASIVTLDGEALALPNTQPTLSEWNGRAFPDEVGAAVRVLPSATMEAFFVAKLTKHASTLRG
ncbi:MAG: hypothetical protein AAFP15_15645, partial [Bacteroidota bacterium]